LSPSGEIEEDIEALKLLLFLEQTGQWLSVHKELFKQMEATTFHLKNTSHMPDRLAMIPEENKGNSTQIHGDIFQQMHVNQRRSLPTSRTHTS
jgi:hypothetical protein